MRKNIILLGITSLFFIIAPHARAAEVSVDAGLQYRCLKVERCQTSGTCTSDHVHRVKLTKTREFITTAGTSSAYVTECIEVVEAGANQPTMICTTGSAALDQALWNQNLDAANFLTRLSADPINYSLNREAGYGVFHLNPTTNQLENTGPKTVALDEAGLMTPTAIEWQSYTKDSRERAFLVWRTIPASTAPATAVDNGQKQGTLTWDSVEKECGSQAWDPKGVVYDVQSGMPINDVDLTVQFSETATGPFEIATAGIGKVLPPGSLPLRSQLAGLYSFFGLPGYYVIQPTNVAYEHAPKATVIPDAVAALYSESKNYYSDSSPILEVAGTVKVQNIPMILKPGATAPPFTFQILNRSEKSISGGKIQLEGRTNATATLIVETCTSPNGIPNCRNKKEYAPGQGGPSPATDFKYSLIEDEKLLAVGETYLLTVKQYTFNSQPRAFVPALIEKISHLLSQLVPQVFAQDAQTIQMTVEPIPTYVEGYAYDENGATIPNAIVGIYVSFSPAPYYSVRANEMGYFQITSNHLPQDPYTIQFTNPTSTEVTKLSTSSFLAQNNEFMIVEKVNPYITVSETTNPRANVTPAFVPRTAGTVANPQQNSQQPIKNVPSPATQPTTAAKQAQSPNMIALMGMIFLALIGVTVAVFLYFKKKKSMESGNMS